MIRVAIIDDNPAVVYGVKAAIDKHETTEFAFSSSEASDFLQLLEATEVDVLIVDIVLEDGISLNFLDLLRKNHPDKKIIAYSNAHAESIKLYLNRIGIDELIDKREPMETLLSSIEKLAEDSQKSKLPSKKDSLVLSEREMEIIQLLGKGFSSPEIADYLNISHNTVNFHKKSCSKNLK